MSTYNYAPGAIHNDHHKEVIINTSSCSVTDVIKASMREGAQNYQSNAEDIKPVDTSFFCTKQFAADIIEKNIRQAISLASSKADACRRIMALEPLGYVILSNVSDERKAELINPFAAPRFQLTAEDFKKARNR